MSMTKTTDTDDDSTEHIPLDDAGDVTLPVVEVLTGRAFLTGKSGAGKSNSASVIAEELLDRGFPLLIVDTDGEYWGLKEQYEILHVGADEECDLQVGAEHAGKLAELALEDNVPIILDVSGFLDADEGDALVRETARELFQREKKRKKPFLMLVEEIHEYIPADFLDTDIERVQVRRKRTFDAGATPDLDDFERPDLKSVSGDLVDELEQISEQEERRQDRIAQLEAMVAELEEEKAALKDERPVRANP